MDGQIRAQALSIRDSVSLSSCKTLEDVIARYWEREIKLELRLKQKPISVQKTKDSVKKPKTYDL